MEMLSSMVPGWLQMSPPPAKAPNVRLLEANGDAQLYGYRVVSNVRLLEANGNVQLHSHGVVPNVRLFEANGNAQV